MEDKTGAVEYRIGLGVDPTPSTPNAAFWPSGKYGSQGRVVFAFVHMVDSDVSALVGVLQEETGCR